jgi:uncharacterized protein (DUF433 family)
MKKRKRVEIGEHLVVDSAICFGKLTFKGTRVPVATVLNRLAEGRSIRHLRLSWPEVTREAITEAAKLATAALVERSLAQAKATDEPTRSGRSA